MKKRLVFFLVIFLLISIPLFSIESVDDTQDDEANDVAADEYYIKYGRDPNNEKVWDQYLFAKVAQSFLNGYGISFGLDLLFAYFPPSDFYEWFAPWSEHMIGIDYLYQFAKGYSSIRIDYTYFLDGWIGLGLVNSYNINKNEFSLGPKIGLHFRLPVLPVKMDIDYRYNFVLNNRTSNFHEIVWSFGAIIIPWIY